MSKHTKACSWIKDVTPEQFPACVQLVQTYAAQPAEAEPLTPQINTQQGNTEISNLAFHVGNNPLASHQARVRLLDALPAAESIYWLNQVHGTKVVVPKASALYPPEADGLFTSKPAQALSIMTADCAAVALCSQSGRELALVHAGWRGALNNIVAEAALKFKEPVARVFVSPLICSSCFEVGAEVEDAFLQASSNYASAFVPSQTKGKFLLDLIEVLRLQTSQLGAQFYAANQCSYTSLDLYSHRREPGVGRMALVGLIKPS